MAAGTWTVPAGNKVNFLDGTHDFNTHTFKCALFNSSYVTTTTTYSTTNELSTAAGYTQGGVTLSTVSLGEAGGTVTWDFSTNPSWTASTGTIGPAKYAVVYNDTDASKTIVCYVELETGSTVSVTDGNTLTIQLSANGIFQLS